MPSLACGIFGHEEAGHRLRHQGTAHLRVSRDNPASFAGDAYAAQGSCFHDAGHRAHQLTDRNKGYLTPEGLLQSPALQGLHSARTQGTEVCATPRQLAMDVRQHLARRIADQPDQLGFRMDLLTSHAGALGRAR
jgi:hypothetical protein